MIRTANIEVSLQRLSILRIEHPQANPLTLACTLRAGEALPSGLTVTAEIHTSRNVAAETAPLASTTVTVGADATRFDVAFTSAQLNQTVTPNSTRALWLVLYGVGDADQLYTLATADLLLGWHAISRLTASPPATSILIEKGGVAWATGRAYASGTVVTVGTTAYVATSAHTSGSSTQPGTGASWETVWAVLSGGGGGTVNLTPSRTATAVTITPSGGGTAAEIPQANATHAGVMSADHHNKLNDLPTAATLTALLSGKSDTGHTHSLSFTGDVTGSGTTGSGVALTIANNAVTSAKIAAGAVGPTQLESTTVTAGTYANPSSLTVDADGRITSITAGSPGTKTLFKFFPREAEFPTSAFATLDVRGTTPHPVLNFDDNTAETVVFRDYISEGVTFADTGTAVAVFCDFIAFSATTNVLGLNVSWERLAPGEQDLDSDGFGTAQAGSVTVDATSGKMHRVQVNFTKAQLPSGFAAGDMFRLRIQRNTSVGSDHTADAQFVGCFANFTP